MTDQIDLQPILSYARQLGINNDRVWFNAHRDQYEMARSNFEHYIDALIRELSQTESLGGITPKDCIFRLNRDLRFTKDKTPYKPYMSAYIAPGGRKSRRLGYYVHIEPGDRSMFAGGIHEPEPQQINAWRAAIDRDPQPFMAIEGNATFRRYFGTVNGEKLKTAPKGYSRDHPQLDLLRLKSVTVSRSVSDSLVSSPHLLAETLDTFAAMGPFLRYLGTLG